MGVKGVVSYWEAYIWEHVFWQVKECGEFSWKVCPEIELLINLQFTWFFTWRFIGVQIVMCSGRGEVYNTYSENSILWSWVLSFHEFTHSLHGPRQMPITVMLNLNGFYISLNLHFIFPALATKIYLMLMILVQFSQFLICDNGLPFLFGAAYRSVWIYISSDWCMTESDSWAYHAISLWPSAQGRIFLPPRSKQPMCTKPALNLMCLSITVTQLVYFVSHVWQVYQRMAIAA
jgi:hypothetical protein